MPISTQGVRGISTHVGHHQRTGMAAQKKMTKETAMRRGLLVREIYISMQVCVLKVSRTGYNSTVGFTKVSWTTLCSVCTWFARKSIFQKTRKLVWHDALRARVALNFTPGVSEDAGVIKTETVFIEFAFGKEITPGKGKYSR